MPSTENRPSIWKILLPVLFLIVIVVGALSFMKTFVIKTGQSHNHGTAIQGATLPDFTLKQVDGNETKTSLLKGRITLLNFWASWCEACMEEMPSLLALRKAYLQKGLEVVLVNLDENAKEVVPKTLKKLGIDFPIYVDADQKLSELFNVQAVPLTVIISSGRVILWREDGSKNWDGADVHTKIEGWLKSPQM